MPSYLRFPASFLLAALLSSPAWAAHPLVTDDTGTQGSGHWQFELSHDWEKEPQAPTGTARSRILASTLTYGLGDTIDIGIALSHEHSSDPTGSQSGMADVVLQSKWRFYENNAGWSLAFKPVLTLPTGNSTKGFGTGRSTLASQLIAQYTQEKWTWMGNLGLQWNQNSLQEREQLWNASIAGTYAIAPKWTAMAEWSVRRDADPTATYHPQQMALGLAWHPSPDMDIDFGLRRSVRHAEQI